MGDFIEDLKNAILADMPTDPDWAECVAINTLNAVVGPFLKTTTKYGPLNTNLDFLVIGGSGTHKTNPLRYFAVPILKAFDSIEKPSGKKTDTIRCERWSVEGLYDELRDHSSGIIIRDEFSTVFKESHKGYLQDVLEVFSELYDGMAKKRRTKSGGLVSSKEVRISLLGATTSYIFKTMDRDFFIQGTGNRFLYVMGSSKPEKVDQFFLLPSDLSRIRIIDGFANRLYETWSKIHDRPILSAVIVDPTHKLIDFKNETSEMIEKFTIEKDELMSRYYSRLAEFAIKLAVLKGISDESFTVKSEEGIGDHFIVNETQVDWAINRVRRHIDHFNKLKDAWRINPEGYRFKTDEESIEYMKQILRDAGRPLETREFSKASRLYWNRFKELLETLLTTGEVEKIEEGRKVLYRLSMSTSIK